MADVVAKGGTTLYASPERVTLYVDARGRQMSGTLDPKDPAESKAYFVDVTSWMASLGTSAASLGPATSDLPGVVIEDSELLSGTLIKVQIAGGSDGDVAKVTVPFSTVDSQDLIVTLRIPIEEK